jgi:Divergent InlB B-repeat domain
VSGDVPNLRPAHDRVPIPSRSHVAGLILFVALLVLGSLLPGVQSSRPAPAERAPAGTLFAPLAHAPGVALPTNVAPSSGRGGFYANSILPLSNPANDACFGATCVNATTDPSINRTSTGLIAVAYTSYSDNALCGVSTFTEIAIVTSRNGGGNWSSPTYLNNPACGSPVNNNSLYNNSWQPALTSLANGTLVLAYVEYDLNNSVAPDLEWDVNSYVSPVQSSFNVPYDRLVVTESYDNGTIWTLPQVINASENPSGAPALFRSPFRPAITAFGDTVYLSWTALQTSIWEGDFGNAAGASNVVVEASKTGGRTWGAPNILPTMRATISNASATLPVAMNPALQVLPNGALTVAYVGNVTVWSNYPVTSYASQGYCGVDPGGWNCVGGRIIVGRSTNNGSSFSYAAVPTGWRQQPAWILNAGPGVPFGFSFTGGSGAWGGAGVYDSMYPLLNPAPSLTYDSQTGELYVGYIAGNISGVSLGRPAGTVFVSNSSDGGSQWSPPTTVDPTLVQNGTAGATTPYTSAARTGCAYSTVLWAANGACANQAVGDASLAISNGTLVVAFSYDNYTACGVDSLGLLECGMLQELVYDSRDNGSSFYGAGSASYNPAIDDALYAGASSSAVGTSTGLWIAWTNPTCPTWNVSVCLWPQAGPAGPEVTVSQPFIGSGLTVNFQPSGLPAWMPWSVTFGANLRAGSGTTPLVVSGVPAGDAIQWAIPSVPGPYATFATPTANLSSPTTFIANTTIGVAFSPPFTGNVSVQYSEVGLPSGLNWSLTLGGVERSAIAPSSITFLGVPSGRSVGWVVGTNGVIDLPTSYGTQYAVTSTNASSPYTFSSNTSVGLDFTEQFAVNIGSDPSAPICEPYQFSLCWNNQLYSSFNYNLTGPGLPYFGTPWIDNGTTVSIGVQPIGMFCPARDTCYEENLSFEAWLGDGLGSVNTSGANVSFTVSGPMNETAEFAVTGACALTGGYPQIIGAYCSDLNYTISFLESGLPNGTLWGATARSPIANTFVVNQTVGAVLNLTNGSFVGPVSYAAWSVPATGGQMWLPVSYDPEGPLVLPGESLVGVRYALGDPSSRTFPVQVLERGLPPNATGFPFTLDGANLSASGLVANLTLTGGTHTWAGGRVYSTNGTGYEVNGIDVLPGVVNQSWVNGTGGSAAVSVDGPATVILNFTPIYYVSVSSGFGGSVNGLSQWVLPGAFVTLSAEPDAGYAFVGWTGSGDGSTSSTASTISFSPNGSVSEFAAFEHLPVPTFTATVSFAGLPAGTVATVEIGERAYSSPNATFAVAGLNGSYALLAPLVYANASVGALTRYLAANVTTSFPEVLGNITIQTNGTISVEYAPQYLVQISETGAGSTDPAPGSVWMNGSSKLQLNAIPATGSRFLGWAGTGSGSESGSSETISVSIEAPILEVASFGAVVPARAATFDLTVTESGLPSGTSWSFGLGSVGSAGSNDSLGLGSLNGSYLLTIPIVAGPTGIEFLPNVTSESLSVSQNVSIPVTFHAAYRISVENGTGGTASASATGWLASGILVTFTAAAAAGWIFSGWEGAGNGSLNSTATSIAISVGTGPILEKAVFALAPRSTAPVTTVTPASALPIDVGLLIGLLLVGLVLAWVVRGRGPPGSRLREPESPREAPAEPVASRPEPEDPRSKDERDDDEEEE